MTIRTKGDAAFGIAFSKFTDTVYRVARHNCASVTDAEDITQDVFLKLLESRKAFKDEEHLKAWLIRVTINLCHNLHRSRSRELPMDTLPDAPTEDSTSTVMDAVRALPELQRNCIYLHYYEGYTAKEIGNILSLNPNTVLSHLHRGREALKMDIGGTEDA